MQWTAEEVQEETDSESDSDSELHSDSSATFESKLLFSTIIILIHRLTGCGALLWQSRLYDFSSLSLFISFRTVNSLQVHSQRNISGFVQKIQKYT